MIGVVRLHIRDAFAIVGGMLLRVQNDLFDLGADLCVPDTGKKLDYEPLRVTAEQVKRREDEIDQLSDFLFVASRYVNDRGAGDVLWVPGKNR